MWQLGIYEVPSSLFASNGPHSTRLQWVKGLTWDYTVTKWQNPQGPQDLGKTYAGHFSARENGGNPKKRQAAGARGSQCCPGEVCQVGKERRRSHERRAWCVWARGAWAWLTLLDKDKCEKQIPKENNQDSSVHVEHQGTMLETTATWHRLLMAKSELCPHRLLFKHCLSPSLAGRPEAITYLLLAAVASL